MGTVINLNRYRKQKQSAERERRANARRARFGISKVEQSRTTAQRSLDDRRLEGSRRDDRSIGRDE
jgi:hypothetical protein